MAPDERCTPHGLWSCTACVPPGPTLAEMVTELDKFAWNLRGGPDVAKALVPMLRELDRRLTALEGRAIAPAPELLAARARWVAAGYTQCPSCATLHKGSCPLCSRSPYTGSAGPLGGEPPSEPRPAFVLGLCAPCASFASAQPWSDLCARCGFAEGAHRG